MSPLQSRILAAVAAVTTLAAIGCSADGGGTGSGAGAGNGSSGTASGGAGGNGAGSGTGPTGTGGDIFVSSGSFGAGGGGGGSNCDPALTGVVRDFRAYNGGEGHPDFETFTGSGLKGIVEQVLGADHKPVYAHAGGTAHTTGPQEFNQWYRDVEGVNIPLELTILPVVDANGIATYDNSQFFPIDDKGFGDQGNAHNFHFTFELHMSFVYKGGEIFSFTGDDDLWVFVNNRLAIDLGGLHGALSDTLDLDMRAAELGIEPGKEYPLDFFHAERHTDQSNFKIQSSLTFTNCDPIVY
jgi:fibro-slime domain-containing protein